MLKDPNLRRIIVGVGGGSASGKTTICRNVTNQLCFDNQISVLILSFDNFYKGLDGQDASEYNFDHPDALDFDLAFECLQSLSEGKTTKIPNYNFSTHSREDEWIEVVPTDIILFEGIFAIYHEPIRSLMQYMIFMHCDDDLRLCRRVMRDVRERGREVKGILSQYNKFVKKSMDEFVRPTMNYADMIVPGNRSNTVSINFIVQHLKTMSKQIGLYKKAIRNDIVFSGDMVESFENTIGSNQQSQVYEIYATKEDTSFKKFLIFPQQEALKKEVMNAFNILNDKFTLKSIKRVFKDLFKIGMQMLQIAIRLGQLSIVDTEVVEIFGDWGNWQLNPSRKEFKKIIIICLAIFWPSDQPKLEELIKKYKNDFPHNKVVFITGIAPIEEMINFQKYDNIMHFINSLCLANVDKFKELIEYNFEGGDKDLYTNASFFSNKAIKRVNKSLAKAQEKEKKDSQKKL